MVVRVNGRFARRLAPRLASIACLASGCGAGRPETAARDPEGDRHGGSTIEIRAQPGRQSDSGPELGDGSVPSETVAGAVRLLGLEVDDKVFVKHALAGALASPSDLRPAPLPEVGDIARAPGVTAVVEATVGASVRLVGLRGGRVERWTRLARGLRFERPAGP
ncbi:MAG: hypothetical protein U1F43_36000 [Myxococcota bacterium]